MRRGKRSSEIPFGAQLSILIALCFLNGNTAKADAFSYSGWGNKYSDSTSNFGSPDVFQDAGQASKKRSDDALRQGQAQGQQADNYGRLADQLGKDRARLADQLSASPGNRDSILSKPYDPGKEFRSEAQRRGIRSLADLNRSGSSVQNELVREAALFQESAQKNLKDAAQAKSASENFQNLAKKSAGNIAKMRSTDPNPAKLAKDFTKGAAEKNERASSQKSNELDPKGTSKIASAHLEQTVRSKAVIGPEPAYSQSSPENAMVELALLNWTDLNKSMSKKEDKADNDGANLAGAGNHAEQIDVTNDMIQFKGILGTEAEKRNAGKPTDSVPELGKLSANPMSLGGESEKLPEWLENHASEGRTPASTSQGEDYDTSLFTRVSGSIRKALLSKRVTFASR